MSIIRSPILFREEQRWRDVVWVMVLVFGLAATQWFAFFRQIVQGVPFGSNPGSDGLVIVFWLLFGIGMPLFFLFLRLVVEVHPDTVVIRYAPLTTRAIPLRDIATVDARTYQPLREFGGWGIRGWGGRIAYNISGDRGVELTLVDGRRVLLGSQRADELAAAISSAWLNRP